MKLSSIIPEKHIFIEFHPKDTSVSGIITEIVDRLIAVNPSIEKELDRGVILQSLIEREKEHSTALGHAFAFPHARLEKLQNAYNVLAIIPEGVDFNAPDQLPCKYIFLSLTPRIHPQLLLKAHAAILRFLQKKGNIPAIDHEDAHSLWRRIDASGVMVTDTILAKDVMHPVVGTLSPEMTMEEAARALHKHCSDALPMLDHEGRFLCEFSCYDLFAYGIPKCFSRLSDASFAKSLNPFERYFKVDRSQKIGTIEQTIIQPVIKPTDTLMEIIFQMTSRNLHQLYVLSADQKLLGVIDRYTIIDKILMSYF